MREPYDLAARNPRCSMRSSRRSRARRSRWSISPAAPARPCARSAHVCRRGRNGGWSTTISACSRSAATLGRPPNVRSRRAPVDLARDLELALDGPLDLVTTSALLDLVSDDWLERLVIEAAARRLPVYAALSYDGRARFDPADPLDIEIVAAVNRHQRTDKGFGPALGPSAAEASGIFKRRRLSSSRAVRLGVRRGRRESSARCCRLGRCGARTWRSAGRTTLRIGWRGGCEASPPAAQPCASVTSISSRCRCRSAERRGRSRTELRRRGRARASASASPDRSFRSARGCNSRAGADDDRRDHHMQPVEAPGGKEPRNGIRRRLRSGCGGIRAPQAQQGSAAGANCPSAAASLHHFDAGGRSGVHPACDHQPAHAVVRQQRARCGSRRSDR